MKRQLSLSALFVIALAVPVFGQVFPSGEGKISEKYDRFTDKTTVMLHSLQVAKKERDFDHQRIYFSAGSIFEYVWAARKPEFVIITFQSWSLWDDQYREAASLNAIVDGERMFYGRLAPLSREVVNGKYVVLLGDRMAFTDFMQIVNAKKVEMRLGDVEFSLDENAFRLLREFAKRIQPQ